MQAVLFPMELSVQMVLIATVGVFLAAFVDGIAGGGGLISVPCYFLAGLPAHLALGTNKLSSCIGTTVSAGRYIRGGFVDWRLGIPSVALAMAGAALGLIAGVASIAGHWLGSGLAIKDGSRVVRPVILLVLAMLTVKVITELF